MYDSRINDGRDFGPGWLLTFSESISRQGNRLILRDSSNSTFELLIDGNVVTSRFSHISGEISGEFAHGSITLEHAGMRKYFRRRGNEYVLARVSDAYGNWLKIRYQKGLIVGTVSSSGRSLHIRRDSMTGMVVAARDDTGRIVSFEYDENGRLAKFFDVGGGEWRYEYNSDNVLTGIVDPRGIANLSAAYSNGIVASVQVQHDTYSFQYRGRLTTVTNALSQSAIFSASRSGLTRIVQDFSGHISELVFDRDHALTAMKFDGQALVNIEYNDDGQPKRLENLSSDAYRELEFEYDNKTLRRVTGDGMTVASYEYNVEGDVVGAVDPLGERTYHIDSVGRTSSITRNTYEFNFVSNDIGMVEDIYLEGEQIAHFDIDYRDKIIGMSIRRDDDQFEVTYSYEPSGLRDVSSYYEGLFELDMDYDSVGNMRRHSLTSITGKSLEDQYLIGPANQLDAVVGQSGPDISFIYDALGRPTEMHQEGRVAEIKYDDLGRLIGADVDSVPLFQISYKPMERDAVIVADLRTSTTLIGEPVVSSIFGTLDSIAYSRPTRSAHPFIQFDDQMARFVVDAYPVVAPDAIRLASHARRMFPTDGQRLDALPLAYDKPSNSLFVPAEFYSTNCFTCQGSISGADIEVNGSDLPTEANVNQTITFDFTADGICRWREEEDIFGLPPIYQPISPPPANFKHYISYGDGNFDLKLSGPSPNLSFNHSYSSSGEYLVLDFVKCSCASSLFSLAWAGHVVEIDDPAPNPHVNLALTFDDGPHLGGRTTLVINTLASKSAELAKPVSATFYVERQRIGSQAGRDRLALMRINGHEIAIHGAHTEHHTAHQNTPDMPTKLFTMKSIINSAATTNPANVRPPFGWGGWVPGTYYTQAQLTTIYSDAGLTRFVSPTATGGVNSWFGGAYSRTGSCQGCVSRPVFVAYVKAAIDLSTVAFTPNVVLLMHDIRDADSADIGGIIDEIEAYADSKNVTVNYRPVNSLSPL